MITIDRKLLAALGSEARQPCSSPTARALAVHARPANIPDRVGERIAFHFLLFTSLLTLRSQVESIDKNLPVFYVSIMKQHLSEKIASQRPTCFCGDYSLAWPWFWQR